MNSILKIFDPISKTWKGVTAIKGDTGKSAYQLATEGGYKGTEAQFKTEQANVANNSARLTTVEQSKANLVDGYVPSNEIDPLQGKQTGCVCNLGAYYYNTSIIHTGSFSVEALYTRNIDGTSNNICVLNSGIYLRNVGNNILIYNGLGGYVALGTLSVTNKTHHIIVSYDVGMRTLNYVIDGVYHSIVSEVKSEIKSFYTNSSGFPINNGFHQSRLFNKALTQQEMLALWNYGRPEEYRLIDKSNLFAEYLPEYLSTTKWIDSSGNGNDLAAIGNVALNYGRTYSGSPSGLPMTPLFVARGATFNPTTGYYEMNGLTDITEAQMVMIYLYSANTPSSVLSCNNLFYGRAMRTNYAPITGRYHLFVAGGNTAVEAIQMFRAISPVIEVINLGTELYIRGVSNYFAYDNSGVSKLKLILGTLDITNVTSMLSAFRGCVSLVDLEIRGCKISLSFSDSPLLTRESIVYLITNAANTTPITVTLHAEAKARLTAEDIALASTKNLTIA